MAGTSSASGRRAGPIVGINVTPMVDVVLVLLVIMMVSAVYIVSQSLKVELPKTANSDAPADSPLAVTITKEGGYLYEQKPIEENELVAKLRAAKDAKGDPALVVTADRAALHGDVVHVIDLAKSQGITKFAINVERN
ncbi:MAG TPA: biopolymer transporter ExbD [Polyangiaceae bacterium]|jgi:biopolymer transport protein ExbD|nr:biopolymer transporter ExbD [Polyangiaceae bacterium]